MLRKKHQPIVRQTSKKEKKADVTGRKLKRQGYAYKMDELTREQRREQREGIKEVDEKGKVHTYDPPDYNYYYKQIGDVIVKIYKAGDKFYYKNVQFRYMETLPQLEQRAKVDAVYDALDAKVKDTLPEDEPQTTTAMLPDMIELVGGPLHGHKKPYNKTFPTYMTQYRNPDTGKIDAVRYKSPMAGAKTYIYLDSIPGK